jgi:hypothetical protein
MARRIRPLLTILFLTGSVSAGLVARASAQTTTYHLHNEPSGLDAAFRQLKIFGPDISSVAKLSNDLKNLSGEFPIANFHTQTDVPHLGGVIPSGSTVTFTLWMRKTSNWGTIYPRVSARLNGRRATQP